MSQEFQDWYKEMVRQTLTDCISPLNNKNKYVVEIDALGLCMERFKLKKHYNPPKRYCQILLTELHIQAQQKLGKLRDPDEQKRCQEIIRTTLSDRRASNRKNPKGVEVTDIFADTE